MSHNVMILVVVPFDSCSQFWTLPGLYHRSGANNFFMIMCLVVDG